MLLASVLWWFAYPLSAHRFYLGNNQGGLRQGGTLMGGLLMLGIGVAGNSTAPAMLEVILLSVVILGELVDVFRIPAMCHRANVVSEAEHRIFG